MGWCSSLSQKKKRFFSVLGFKTKRGVFSSLGFKMEKKRERHSLSY